MVFPRARRLPRIMLLPGLPWAQNREATMHIKNARKSSLAGLSFFGIYEWHKWVTCHYAMLTNLIDHRFVLGGNYFITFLLCVEMPFWVLHCIFMLKEIVNYSVKYPRCTNISHHFNNVQQVNFFLASLVLLQETKRLWGQDTHSRGNFFRKGTFKVK